MKEKSRCSILFHLLVPWREVTDRNRDLHLVGQFLYLCLPKAKPLPVASSRIGRDQASLRLRISLTSHPVTTENFVASRPAPFGTMIATASVRRDHSDRSHGARRCRCF